VRRRGAGVGATAHEERFDETKDVRARVLGGAGRPAALCSAARRAFGDRPERRRPGRPSAGRPVPARQRQWVAATEIPADKSYIGSWESIHDTVQEQLHGLVEAAARRRDDADARRIADLYASFMDEAAVERAGIAPLAGELAAIEAIRSPAELARAIGRLDRLGVNVPLDANIEQDARDAHALRADPRPGRARPARPRLLPRRRRRQVRRRAGELRDVPREAAAALGRWRRRRRFGCCRDRARDGARARPVDARRRAATGQDVQQGRDGTARGARAGVRLAGLARRDRPRRQGGRRRRPAAELLGALSSELAATPLPVWRTYLRTALLHSYAPYLGKDFVAARFAFASPHSSGATENQPRWKRGVALVAGSVGESLGKLYVEKYFHPSRRRGWKRSSPTCSPRTARASTRSTG
jgi:hypothetical protein